MAGSAPLAEASARKAHDAFGHIFCHLDILHRNGGGLVTAGTGHVGARVAHRRQNTPEISGAPEPCAARPDAHPVRTAYLRAGTGLSQRLVPVRLPDLYRAGAWPVLPHATVGATPPGTRTPGKTPEPADTL